MNHPFDAEEPGPYASSPCMMPPIDALNIDPLGDDILGVLYLRINEGPAGFTWEVRVHDAPEAVVVDLEPHASEAAARAAGQAALDQAARRLPAR